MRIHLAVKLYALFLIGLQLSPNVDSLRLQTGCDCQTSGIINQETSSNNQQQITPPCERCLCQNPALQGYVRMPGLGYVRPTASAKTWLEANAECAAEGATLPVPRNHAMAEALAGAMDFRRAGVTTGDWAWLGANDFEEEGKWVTADGLLVNHVSTMTWYPGEPNYKREENCMVFNRGKATVGDAPCTWKLAFVCYIPFNA